MDASDDSNGRKDQTYCTQNDILIIWWQRLCCYVAKCTEEPTTSALRWFPQQKPHCSAVCLFIIRWCG